MNQRRRQGSGVWIAWIVLFFAGVVGGCRRDAETVPADAQGSAASASSTAEPSLTPEEILGNLVAAYGKASSYHDEGVFRATFQRGEETVKDSAPLAVSWTAPNRMTVRAYQAAIASDGRWLRAKILDELSGDLDGQVVERPIGDRLTLEDLFSDALLRESLGGRMGLHPLQLELLLAEKPLAGFLAPSVVKRLLGVADCDGHACYRIKADLQGRYVFWVDCEDFLLRRLEYPGDALLVGQDAEEGTLTIVADFAKAQFGDPPPQESFSLAALGITESAAPKKVRFFVAPPQPLPTTMFGKRPEEFEFAATNGGAITPDSLQGKITVLAWFSNHPGSQACLQAIDKVRQEFSGNDQVAFYGVCTEPSSVSNAELQTLASAWGVQIPVVRDLGAYGRDQFEVDVAPSLIVLDKAGAVQIHESGANPRLASLVQEQLADLVRRLVDGEDFAAAILTQARAEQESYQANLQAASIEGASHAVQAAPAEVAPKSEPQQLRLTPLWSNQDIDAPGNIVVIPGPEGPRTLVLAGGRNVVELDDAGTMVQRTELDLPAETTVSYLRTATDNQGRRYFAVFSLLGPHAHVFDETWRRILSYPATEERHAGLRDVALADMTGAGVPMLAVGFWGSTGVHGVDLHGARAWSNRELTPVLSLAAMTESVVGRSKILVTGEAGHILRLNQYGTSDAPLQVARRAIHHVFAAGWPTDRPTAYLGVSYAPEGNLVAIGLSRDFQEMWSYRLPHGAHGNQIQFASSCRLFGADGGQWLLAGPDGSIHLISDDGEFFDYFQHGQRLAGLAGAQLAGQDVLIVATANGVAAIGVEQPSTAAASP